MTDAGHRLLRVLPAGDAALIAEFPMRIDPVVNAAAHALGEALRARWGAILRDVVVGYCSVTAYYDPATVDGPWLQEEIRLAARDGVVVRDAEERVVEVPVCYDEEFGPDLGTLAVHAGGTTEDVVALHASRQYRVYMIGFVPGFAYMAEVDARIAAPRRATPRAAVPAGSVGIAGGQTGIYPSVTPGGWNLVGRTPLVPFDMARDEPCLFRPGDTVQFVRISRSEYERRSRP